MMLVEILLQGSTSDNWVYWGGFVPECLQEHCEKGWWRDHFRALENTLVSQCLHVVTEAPILPCTSVNSSLLTFTGLPRSYYLVLKYRAQCYALLRSVGHEGPGKVMPTSPPSLSQGKPSCEGAVCSEMLVAYHKAVFRFLPCWWHLQLLLPATLHISRRCNVSFSTKAEVWCFSLLKKICKKKIIYL